MNRKLFGIRFVCAVAMACACADPAAAQQQDRNPFSGLFRRSSPREQPHTLDLRGSIFGAYDDNLLATVPGGAGQEVLDPRYLKSGMATGLDGGVAYGYHRSTGRSQFFVSSDASIREFGSALDPDSLWFYSAGIGTGISANLTNKTTFAINAATAYAPYYQYVPFLKDTFGEGSPVGSDYGFAAKSQSVVTVDTSASLVNRFSKRSSIGGDVAWGRRHLAVEDGIDLDMRSARATFTHNLTRKLEFHAGYGVMQARYSNAGVGSTPALNHIIDVGVGYGDGLTINFARVYTLTLGVGLSVIKNGDPQSVLSTGKSTAFRVDGNASLNRSIRRTWNAFVGYTRGTSYIVGFQEPIFSDTASTGIGGPVAPRVHASAGAGVSRGQFVFATTGDKILSYSASSRLTFAIFKNLGAYAQASYYKYDIPSSTIVALGFVPNLGRRSVSVGLNTWVPLIKQRRSSRDSG